MTSRRDLEAVGGLMTRRGAVALTGAMASGFVLGTTVAPRAQTAPHSFKLGSAAITVISDGAMSLPLSFVLPQTEPARIEQLLANRGTDGAGYTVPLNVTLVKTANALIAIDSGGSTDFMPAMGKFSDAFERAGFQAADVTHVIFTHAHPDHFWGLIDPLDDDTRFPNARHIMTTAERDHWLRPGVEDAGAENMKGITLGTVRRMKKIASRIEPAKIGAEIVPGVTLVDTAGHTPGHASVLLNFDGQSLLVGGDALAHPIFSFERPEWVWGADFDAQMAIPARKRLLDQLATDRVPLLGYHLPWPGLGRVERKDGTYRFVAS